MSIRHRMFAVMAAILCLADCDRSTPAPTSQRAATTQQDPAARMVFLKNTSFKLGETWFTSPAPKGFVRVVPEMKNIYELTQKSVPSGNVLCAFFITEQDASAVFAGEPPSMARSCSIQVRESLVNQPVTKEQFATLEDQIQKQIDGNIEDVTKRYPEYFDKSSRMISDTTGVDVMIKFQGMVPLPVHEKTDRMMAFSMYLSGSIKLEEGEPKAYTKAVTATAVRARNRLVYLYAGGEKGDLEWSKECAKQWMKQFLAENPN